MGSSAKISPYEIEAEEREHSTSPEYVHVLRTAKPPRQKDKPSGTKENNHYAPSALDPANNIPTEPERSSRIAQSALCALEHRALIDEAIEHLPSLRQELVQPRLRPT